MEENLFLFRRFRTLDQAGKQRVDQQFNAMELTAMQSYVLRYLHDRRGEVVYPKDIEQRFRLTHPTVSGLLARLEAKGFVTCTPDPDDRRCKRVAETAKAGQCHLAIHETFRELEQQTLRGFTPEEIASLLALLDRAIANLYETQEEPRPCSND